MSFLFPLYLLGALAIAAPILLHLRRRPPKDHVEFSSLMFLEKTPERLTRRTRLEKWLLLALRCLALLALALVFARPFMKSTSLPMEGGSLSATYVLVDRSASMQRESLFEDTLKQVGDFLDELDADEQVSIGTFDQDVEQLTDFTTPTLAKGALVGIDCGWLSTDSGEALASAANALSSYAGDRKFVSKRVVVFSDFTQGAKWDALAQIAWPDDVQVECRTAEPRKVGNLSLALAATSAEAKTSAEPIYRVRISNT
ncbi:MAG: BatA domain-containing protein, partial [Verrucomicrobiota bacterium]